MKAVCASIKALHSFCETSSPYKRCEACTAFLPVEVDMRRHRGLFKVKMLLCTPEELEETNFWQGFEASCVWFHLPYLWGYSSSTLETSLARHLPCRRVCLRHQVRNKFSSGCVIN